MSTSRKHKTLASDPEIADRAYRLGVRLMTLGCWHEFELVGGFTVDGTMVVKDGVEIYLRHLESGTTAKMSIPWSRLGDEEDPKEGNPVLHALEKGKAMIEASLIKGGLN